jgi:hypothetical protein
MPALFDRYQRGDHLGVWDELHSMGARVRDAGVYEDAEAVARETVRRARANFETIIQRLDAMGYRFEDEEALAAKRDQRMDRIGGLMAVFENRAKAGPGHIPEHAFQKLMGSYDAAKRRHGILQGQRGNQPASQPAPRRVTNHLEDELIYARAPKDAAKNIAEVERQLRGPLPLLLAAWWEQIDSISLVGSHPAFCPAAAPMGLRFGGTMFGSAFASTQLFPNPNPVTPDPFVMFSLDVTEDIELDGDEMQMPLGPDEIAKAGESGDFYYVTLPAASADFAVEGTPGDLLFVDYLRRTFGCGGFPGWHGRADKPAEIEALSLGLLAV